MSHLKKFLIVSIVLQVAMVVAGHFSMEFRNLSPIFGMGIPVIVGWWYGATAASNNKAALTNGFLIGFIGAFLGVLLAVLLKHGGGLAFLLLAPLSSGVTGLIGGILGYKLGGKKG